MCLFGSGNSLHFILGDNYEDALSSEDNHYAITKPDVNKF